MAKYSRVTAKVFGETASTSSSPVEIGQFGSAKAGTYNATGDIATIQSLSAWSNGWIGAVTPTQQFPPLPEMTGVHKVLSQQIAYLLQQGVAEWDSGTTYYINGFCSKTGKVYISQTDNNLNNDPENDTINWREFSSGSSRNIGEIVASTTPLTDAGLHLLDGSLLTYGSYQAVIDYYGDLYDSGDYTAIFDTEANWQTAVTTYGVCGKFVYDSVNKTLRLPKWGNQTWTGGGSAQVKGTGKTLGLTNGTSNIGIGLSSQASSGILAKTSYFDSSVGYQNGSNWATGGDKACGVTTDGDKSGILADISSLTTSLDCYYYIVIANTTKTQIQVDIDQIATDLNGKADVDLTNVNNSGTSKSAGWSMPSETFVNLTLGASTTIYTAPANGFMLLQKQCTGSGQYIWLQTQNSNGDSIYDIAMYSTASGGVLHATVPVKKGGKVYVGYTAGGTTDAFKFVYAVGSESEA